MAHTPGPWKVGYWSGRCRKPEHAGAMHPGLGGDNPCVYESVFVSGFAGIAADNGKMVVDTNYDELVISDDDALLIAAAPDLLEACEALCEYIEYLYGKGLIERPRQLAEARAAITKATP